MKSAVVLFALAVFVCGDQAKIKPHVVNVTEPKIFEADAVEPEAVFIIGYLKNVAVPAGEARRKAGEQYLQQNRIVGGAAAQLGQFPWQAGLVSDIIGLQGNGVCGASLVSHNRLVTAAHCWFDGLHQAWRLTVVLGSVLLFGTDGVRQQTTRVINHPKWTPYLIHNDVAMIYLQQTVSFSNVISLVSLPNQYEQFETFVGNVATASEFGLTVNNGGISTGQFLSYVDLPVIANWVCWRSFPLIVKDSNICTSGEGGRSTCRGDSGGPLVVVNRDTRDRPLLVRYLLVLPSVIGFTLILRDY